MKIAVGSDHVGYEIKERIIGILKNRGHEVVDFGTNSKARCDYPLIGEKVARAVSSKECKRGVLVCATGIGMSIVANKFPDVRASLCYTIEAARLTREHNDSNILSLGSLFVKKDKLGNIVRTWLDTPFSGGRHKRRVNEITKIEKKTCALYCHNTKRD